MHFHGLIAAPICLRIQSPATGNAPAPKPRWAILFAVADSYCPGVTETEILADFPYPQPEDIRACLEYAAAEVDHSVLVASA